MSGEGEVRSEGARVPGGTPAADEVRVTAWVRGRVQGVGFRWWVRSRALSLHLVGTARNLEDGRVEVVAEGPRPDCERLLELLAEEPSSTGRPGYVSGVTHRWTVIRDTYTGFHEG